jgi:hypothetical protein
MTLDAQLQFLNLLYTLSQDPRLEQYQGCHLNVDGSWMVYHCWGGLYFENITDLVTWLAQSPPVHPLTHSPAHASAGVSEPVSEKAAYELSNAT